MKPSLPLLAILLLPALSACDSDNATCQTADDCFAGEVCVAKECVKPVGMDMGQDMASDMLGDMPDAMLGDMPNDMPDDMEEPSFLAVVIGPDYIPSPRTPLRCEYTLADGADPGQPVAIEWLVDGMSAGSGQDFKDYGPGARVSCVARLGGRGAPGSSPEILAPPMPVVSAGGGHTCAIFDGEAWCWGDNRRGQLGDGTTTSAKVPVRVQGLTSGVSAIAAGFEHTCAVHEGALKCWGDGASGQLGDDRSTGSPIPIEPMNLSSDITGVSAALSHACAIRSAAAWCWGLNPSGELGTGDMLRRSTPTKVLALGADVSAIAAGTSHTCAIHDGAAKCWGNNSMGQLGDETTTGAEQPGQVLGLTSGVSAISAGSAHTCAIHDGAAKCWGSALQGQLGDGSADLVHVPRAKQVLGLNDGVSAISSGGSHTCAIHDGAAKCWGSALQGQLGDGSADLVHVPRAKQVLGLNDGVSAISSGGSHTCAIHDGAAKCWGEDSQGQLGDGATDKRNVPVQVVSLTAGVHQISAGRQHTCAVVGGPIVCWGDNTRGQLGDGTASITPVTTPIPVKPPTKNER
jgi:alpha-tubulin suppressor-like RCC1 family protein